VLRPIAVRDLPLKESLVFLKEFPAMKSIPHGASAAPSFMIPQRKESYTTWLYMGFALLFAILSVFGIWYAGLPR